MEYEEYKYLYDWKFFYNNIYYNVILPIFVSVGLVVNVIAFCVWVFGQKSKSMCCAIYFAANSAVDFLFLTRPLLWVDFGWYERIIPITNVTCKLFESFYNRCWQLTTCISAIITVERSLTILFPFVFKSQDMRKRSKIVLAVIIVLQPLIQSLTYYDLISGHIYCIFSSKDIFKVFSIFFGVVVFVIPFAVILTFNVATVATLIRQRLRRKSLTGRRDHVNVFTKITLLTGASFFPVLFDVYCVVTKCFRYY